jgi:hypothetical protein
MNGPEPFPCPFCDSPHVDLVGGGLVFLHYRCNDCSEVWTAMAAAPIVTHPRRPEPDDVPVLPARALRKQKVWSH